MKDCIRAQTQLNTKNMFISVFISRFAQEHCIAFLYVLSGFFF